ncbi:16S rRNA (adenine(1518)-N(6)/adenine(1519)-N(6))-dimethyltransferase RsmA [[Eubacterium] hominis]|uniref:16S rRNA (adenine(1518)-N(6)/adenine(1519)-N(6))- dimethyltransferase RsmA n=1 Tax=[Eubacterium] hominis TaxID=2764325 RepID=UPI003A4DC49B
MNKPIATPSRTKEILATYDMFAKKNYGQNFLVDPSVVEKIARNAVVSDHCVVLEIGPGIGALTQYLCEYAQKVISFEIDERLPDVLADTLAEYDHFELVMQDFLNVDLKSYVTQYTKEGYDVVIAANLPYYITTPILFKIFESKAEIAAITVMMQKEVADRFNAVVNTKEYNALSIVTQYRCHVKSVMKVPKNVFMPKPNVDSAVLQFTFKENDEEFDEDAFFELVKGCFKQRRKTILNNYGAYVEDKVQAKKELMMAGIDEQRRAESMTLDEFKHLYEVHIHEN